MVKFSVSDNEVVSPQRLLKVEKKQYIIKCACCEKHLVTIHTTPEIPGKNKIKCFCPFCNDYSFVKEIESKFFIEPVSVKVISVADNIILTEKK